MRSLAQLELVEQKGIAEDRRYFGRFSHGRPSKRQVTVIEREEIGEHAAALGVESFAPGVVRSNIETEGIALIPWLGRRVRAGSAVLEFVEPRTPCHKMDELAQGLRELMENGRQGVIARVAVSGIVRVGDEISVIEELESPVFGSERALP
jgi:MOSC domain-containing protein YiiM